MESPETVPEYVMAVEPTVPNWIEFPATTPLRLTVPSVESLMLPVSFEFDCVQVRVNVPLNAPSYFPDHVPERSPVAAEGLVTGGLVVVGETASGLVATVGDGELLLLLQPIAVTASTASNEARPSCEAGRCDLRGSALIAVRSSFSGLLGTSGC
jgi:hypothetical protein